MPSERWQGRRLSRRLGSRLSRRRTGLRLCAHSCHTRPRTVPESGHRQQHPDDFDCGFATACL